ncbi:MAG: hypothetical protein ACOX8L_04610 [Candidatus Methanomethylophilaceae archaeon]|jgi:hypothetical protein
MKKPDMLTIVAVAILALVLLGEVAVVFGNPASYDAEGSSTAYGADYTLKSSVSTEYRVLALDNGAEIPVSELYIFIDDDYVPYCASAQSADSFVSKVEKELLQRGFGNFERVGADGLRDLIVSASSATGKGILIPLGTLPSTVYTGNPSDPFLTWTAKGGTVYWMGGVPGAYTVSEGETAEKIESPETLFPFVEGASENRCMAATPLEPMCSALTFVSIDTKYSLSPSYPGVKTMGFSAENGHASISSVKDGPGTFFVIAGVPGDKQYYDLSILVAAGVTYDS